MAQRQPFLGDHRGGHAHGGFARRRAPAAARIADAVFLPVAVVRMAGTELCGDVAVVLAARVGIADQQGDGCTGGLAFVHATEYLDLVGFTARGGMARLARGTPVQVGAELFHRDFQPRRATIDHAADGGAMRLAEGGDAEQMAKTIQDRCLCFSISS